MTSSRRTRPHTITAPQLQATSAIPAGHRKDGACAAESLLDDPVRVLRAVRLAAGLGFHIEEQTRLLMKQAASHLGQVSPERIRDELFRILGTRKPDASLRALEMLGILGHLLPELISMKGVSQSPPHIHDVWTHTLAVLGCLEEILDSLRPGYSSEETHDINTGLLTLRLGRYRKQFADHFRKSFNPDRSRRSLLFFAALYHDVSKPETRTVDDTNRIRFFDHEIQGAGTAVKRARSFNLRNDEVRDYASLDLRVSGLLADPAPLVQFLPGFGQSLLNFSLLCHIREIGDQNTVLAALNLRILKRFRKEGIEFPYPTRTIHLRDDRTA